MLESFLVYKYGFPSNTRAMCAAPGVFALNAARHGLAAFADKSARALPAGSGRTGFVHAAPD
ncbi:hypothetical protein WJ978_01495 [Achromobacter xylosoxidans]